MKQFVDIPKIMHFYWGFNSNMSFLNLMTLISFQRHNPDWQIILHKPKRPSKYVLSQYIMDYRPQYTGNDYSIYLNRIDKLHVNEFDFATLAIDDDVAEVFKSDFLRWHLLSTIGGGWSDMDILFLKPIEEIRTKNRMVLGREDQVDTAIVFRDYGYHPIGFYLSKASNPFFRDIFDNSYTYFDKKEYQSVGRLLLDKLFPNYRVIKNKFPDQNILDLSSSTVYPFSPREILLIFKTYFPYKVCNCTIGIHWYNGSVYAKEFCNEYHNHKGNSNRGIWRIIGLGKTKSTIQHYLQDYMRFYDEMN